MRQPSLCLVLVWLHLFMIFSGCQSVTRDESLHDFKQSYSKPKAGFVKIRLAILDFKNSAKMGSFDIIPDGQYLDHAYSNAQTLTEDEKNNLITKIIEPNKDRVIDPLEPYSVDSASVAREVTETLLAQSGYFEIIPAFLLAEKIKQLNKINNNDPLNTIIAAKSLDIEYIAYGDLTNFEIRQQSSFWKIPLWLLLLIGALMIQNDEWQALALEMLFHLMINSPRNSFFWQAGVGWDKLKMDVDVGLNLRLVRASDGQVAFSQSAEITRTDSVKNINLIVWKSNNRVKITQSNAGKQIRFSALAIMEKLVLWLQNQR